MSPLVHQALEELGPSRSSELVKWLVTHGIREDAARKRLSRGGEGIRSLRGVRLPNREAFMYLEEDFQTPTFKHRLANALKDTRTAYGQALVGLESRGGAAYSHYFPIASGLPVAKTKGHVMHSYVEAKLAEVGLTTTTPSPEGTVVTLWDLEGLTARRRAAMLIEDVVLSVMRSWLAKVGWTSSTAPPVRTLASPLPQFGQFAWDLVGPCYLHSVVTVQKGRKINGFVCGDILLDKTITEQDLHPFFAKWDVLRSQRRSTRFQPIFIADSFESPALMRLRERGAFVAIPSTLFGEDAAAQIKSLVGTIENAAAAVTNNPDSVFDLISRVARLEGAALNLRGIFLEMTVAHLCRLRGYNIDIRQQIRVDGVDKTDIDVKATSPAEVVCCECKGKSPGNLVDASEIQEWLDKSLPWIKSWLKESRTLPDKRRFEFYSSTDYTDDARALIARVTQEHQRQPIRFLTGEDVIRALGDQNQTQACENLP